jgi:pimeloyl-ACP methyl ester carboxylesterase
MPSVGQFRYLEAPAHGRAHGTLVLIHAFPLNASMFDAQLTLAEQGWRVLAPQLRGFDGAPGDRPVETVDDYAGDVIDLLDRLHVAEAVIAGVSLGGYISFALFRHAPRYFQGLVLANTRPQADAAQAADGRARMLALLREKGPAGVADDMVPKLLGETTRRERPDLVDRIRTMILANSPEAIAGAISALRSRPDSTPALGSIRCPTLVIGGDEDTLTPPEVAEGMHRAIAGSELVVIAQSGHLSNLEQPAAFNAALARFLSRF